VSLFLNRGLNMKFIKNKTEYAKELWISRATLNKKLKSWEIKLNDVPKWFKYYIKIDNK